MLSVWALLRNDPMEAIDYGQIDNGHSLRDGTRDGMKAADVHASELRSSTKPKPAEVEFVQGASARGARGRDKKSTAASLCTPPANM